MFFHPMSSSVVACRKEPAGTGPVQAVAKGPTASLKQPERPSGASRSKPQVHTEQQSAQALFAPPEKPPAPMHTAQQSAQQPPAPPSKPPPPAHTVQQSVQVLHGPPAVHARSDSHGRSCMHGPVVGPSPVAGTPGRCPQAAASAQLQPQPGAASQEPERVFYEVPSHDNTDAMKVGARFDGRMRKWYGPHPHEWCFARRHSFFCGERGPALMNRSWAPDVRSRGWVHA